MLFPGHGVRSARHQCIWGDEQAEGIEADQMITSGNCELDDAGLWGFYVQKNAKSHILIMPQPPNRALQSHITSPLPPSNAHVTRKSPLVPNILIIPRQARQQVRQQAHVKV